MGSSSHDIDLAWIVAYPVRFMDDAADFRAAAARLVPEAAGCSVTAATVTHLTAPWIT